jgi:signal transduction histidine kinase
MKKKLFKNFLFIFLFTYTTSVYSYQYQDTQNLVNFVDDASKLVEKNGETAFSEFSKPKSKWFHKDTYLFVMDTNGNYVLNGNLEDKSIPDKISNLEKFKKYFLFESLGYKNKNAGWIHYLYQKTTENIPVWKSTYIKKIKSPSGKEYVIASGKYNLKLEKEFVEDEVNKIWQLIREKEQLAFPIIRNKANYFLSNENFVFIIDTDGNILFNTGKPYIEKNNILDIKDSVGTPFISNIIKEAVTKNNGWITYYSPKIDESNPTLKNIYFKTATIKNKKVIVAYSVIFNNSIVLATNKEDSDFYDVKYLSKKITDLIKEQGADNDNFLIYLKDFNLKNSAFVIDANTGIMLFNNENSNLENKSIVNLKDQTGKPLWKNLNLTLDLNNNKGWIHCTMENNKNSIILKCKSTYVTKISLPNNQSYIVGVSKNSENMEKEFLENAVDMAVNLIKQKKEEAFKDISNSQNIFIFKNNHFFVTTLDGVQMLDSQYPSLEGVNILKTQDASGSYIVQKYIKSALKSTSLWLNYPFLDNTFSKPIKKNMFVKKITIDNKTYIVGAEYSANEN